MTAFFDCTGRVKTPKSADLDTTLTNFGKSLGIRGEVNVARGLLSQTVNFRFQCPDEPTRNSLHRIVTDAATRFSTTAEFKALQLN